MAFDRSSKHIDLIDGYLTATCCDATGLDQRSELNLDQHLGNANGFFEWGGVNFSHSARDVVITTHGGAVFIHAKLQTQHKSWRDARVNLSERVANLNGELRYVGGSERKVEHNWDGFLGEEREFLSTAINDTINDLRDIFSDAPWFGSPPPPRSQQQRTQSARDQRAQATERTASTASRDDDDDDLYPSRIHMEDSTISTETSKRDVKSETSTTRKSEPPAYDDDVKTESDDKSQLQAQEHEDAVMQEIKDFLLSGTNHSVHSSKTEKGSRQFVLQEDSKEIKTLVIRDRTFFDQDEYRRDSISTMSEHENRQPRCMTPSVVDGESEYDFLN